MIESQKESAILLKKDTQTVQSNVGTFLYYAWSVEPAILVALNDISGEQACPTNRTQKDLSMLMDFLQCTPTPLFAICFVAGPIQLRLESDTSYLSIKKSPSQYAGHFYLQSHQNIYFHTDQNGPVLTECSVLKNVVCSAAEAECGGCFIIAKRKLLSVEL